MWRFLLPALVVMTGLMALFAASFGEFGSLRAVSSRPAAVAGDVMPRANPPQSQGSSPAVPDRPAVVTMDGPSKRDELQQQIVGLQRQADDLQGQIKQRTQELGERSQELNQRKQELAQRQGDLETVRSEAERLRQSIDGLQQQRQAEQRALAAARSAAASRPAPTPPAAQTTAAPATAASSTPEQLLTAKRWLAVGRPDEARRILASLQTQMVLQSGPPDGSGPRGGPPPSAMDVEDSIRWLDMGASGNAMQAIDRAIEGSSPGPVRAWSGYQAGPGSPANNGGGR